MKRKNYKKMLQDIDNLVNNDWGLEITDMAVMFRKNKVSYRKFTQAEAQQMSKVIGEIYSISHGITCSCGDKYMI